MTNEAADHAGIGGRAVITAVIPTFRRPRLLQRAVRSALAQGDVARIAVFDNCSGDDTAAVVAAIAKEHPQISYHAHASNIGAYANFEYGVRNVETPFFSILSDDDYLLPGFYERALAGLAAHPEALFWVGATLNVDEHGAIWDARITRWFRDGIYLPPEGALAMTGGMAPTWTGIVFRREVLELAGFIDPETVGPSDLDYTLRLGARFPYMLERSPVAVFTLNSQGFSATQPLSSFWPGWLKMFSNVQALPGLTFTDRKKLLDALHVDAQRMLFRRGISALAAGRHDFACEAADALILHYSRYAQAAALKGLAISCTRVPGMQLGLTRVYRLLERRMVRSRKHFQHRFGHLLLPM
jgi:hypothetical protein